MAEYKLTLNTVPTELANGRPLGPGELVELSEEDLEDPVVKELVDSELLLPVEETKPKKGGAK